MRRLLLAAFALAALAAPSAAQAATLPGPWPTFNQGPQHASSSTVQVSSTLQLAWKTSVGSSLANVRPYSGVSLDATGNVYAAADSAIWALNSATGGVLWTSTVAASGLSQPAAFNGTVYTSSGSAGIGHVIGFSTATGAHVFEVQPDLQFGREFTPPSGINIREFNGLGNVQIDPANGLVYASDGDTTLNSSAQNGGFLAMTSTSGVVWAAATTAAGSAHEAAFSPDGSTLYMKTQDNSRPLFAIGAATGAYIWQSNTNTQHGIGGDTGVSVRPDGTIYSYTSPGVNTLDALSAFNPATGAILWSSTVTFTNAQLFHAPVVDGNGRVYVDVHLAAGDFLYGFDGTTGLVTTIIDLGMNGTGGPPAISTSSEIYLIGHDNSSYYLVNANPLTSTVTWKFLLGSDSTTGPFSQPQVVLANGSIYVHANIAAPGKSDFVEAFTPVAYNSLTISTGPAFIAGSVRIATVTVHVTSGGAPVANVPVLAPTAAADCASTDVSASCSPTGLGLLTDLSGNATYQLLWNFGSVALTNYQAMSTTVTAAVPGLSSSFAEHDVVASTYSVTVSSPAVEDWGNGLTVVVTTLTFRVQNSTGGIVGGWPVAAQVLNVNGTLIKGAFSLPGQVPPGIPTEPNSIRGFTDGTGQIQFNYRFAVPGAGLIDPAYLVPIDYLPNLDAKLNTYALSLAPVTVDVREPRASTFTVTYSSPVFQSDIRVTTITVTVYDASGSTVPAIPVALGNFTNGSLFTYAFNGRVVGSPPACGSTQIVGYTDAFGQAKFVMDGKSCAGDTFDNFGDFSSSAPVFAMGVAVATPTVSVESDFLASYDVQVPTVTSVGVSFVSTITAVNPYGHALEAYNESGITLTPLFTGTNVQGSGSLGTSVVSFSGSPGSVVIDSQTYNKIENIQIKATRGSGAVKTGTSGTLVIEGPTGFIVSVPTGAAAGAVFTATITAVDAGGNPVVGYGATLSVTPVVALATGTPASGTLSPASVNLPANGSVVVNNLSYSKGDSIQIKVADSALGISGFSSSMTITQPALTIDHYHITMATSITVGAPFSFDAEPQDASSAPVSYSVVRTLNVQAFLAGTNIAGSGSLGVTTLPLASGATYTFTASQTYNKIESVQLRVTDDDGRVGITSYTVTFNGPTQFVVTVATSAQAGVPFQFVVQAQDSGGSQVLGYDGTVNVSAVDSVNTALAGGGTLGVTSLNLSGGAGSSSFQSYTKAQGIRFRVADSGVGVTTISSSMTIVAGPAASLTLSGNPQSTIATVPSVLTAQAADAFNNPILGSTVTFTVASGSAVVTLGLVGGAVPASAGVVSTQAPTNVSGAATAFFASTTTAFSQGDLVVASLGGLTATTTIYNAVLMSGAGGVVSNQGTPLMSVTVPPSTWGFNVRMSVAGKSELSAADLALTTRAFAASANTFVSTTVMSVDVVRDASPGTLAGAGGKLVSLALPFTSAGGNTTVGSILVPQSVLRVFKLNKQTSIFEMVLDGVNLPQGNGTVSAQVSDPEGIFALGAPAFVTLGGTSSGTVTTALASGAQAVVSVPFGSFVAPTVLTVSPLSAGSIPPLPGGLNLSPTGIAISVNTGGVEPSSPVGVSLGYTAAAVPGLNANQFRVARYDAGVGWKVLDSQVDTAAGTVAAQTDGFSIFEIVAAAPSSSVGAGFVFPNPFRPSLGHVNIKFAGLPAAAHIKVYTVSGRLLKELDADSTGSVLSWNGTDKDGRPLASGVYLAVISDTTGASGKATIKFAVQR